MVRINIIPPRELMDQHLIAEYNEILMLLGYVKKFPETSLEKIPEEFVLGQGHILFFKNKLKYIGKRFGQIREEMKRRGFNPRKEIDLSVFPSGLLKGWKPKEKDFVLIRKRLKEKINKKPEFYSYYGKR